MIFGDLKILWGRFTKELFTYLFSSAKNRAVIRNPDSSSEILKDRSVAVLFALCEGLLHHLQE
jgi:hypothetical protein